ncbi:MAG: asparaginyl/glutamyl-tRNA amidotransferase subunit C [Candidatus Doudnabacteria bacterium RIFCSPHIGHO2_02_FULL_48_21]|uniref:Aspartyl/glutamyl-tRNA(Asn/Gln) amidotransferase subunit C n=1 Tax=Candidatus Doudnabacteria bacterium RIFCSPLOWO2_02_FULL_48_13 TaxID=1817845 RepID=A0A1F5Q9Z9_9BACT|nr:MAG: asparaginyl/glutamyl-tRNA amidotransferase subunit C [Candidatus Doudnabacteria bacterium RIFCSPHIGHO2_01_48_18]OGE78436.1 MAG: asparaginyl/glutamyl-tRNA amidotransferase subunit C [Candidatus Doudnabacteria bacterium RIFCSPHIGHO2_01_FULL_48_180]OGE91690.1 MAG: asparaginyl/glutamyl-tRNA amidotransferase subunit C [Candidatus Doudnabacteria bacterium RIFCSPHIGHO2_12_FULL_47_25]OGE93427.1 MAG: asparaginyl/glutamyl-tRNA amidotransferase subunit C [Candidatus Doudnabacteria bacterium RIFCSPH
MIKKEEVAYIAKLARIELTDEDLVKYRTDLNKILGYIEVLKTVDTEGVEPLAQVTGLENVYRADEVNTADIADELLSSAPETSGRFIKVKKVL